MKHDADIGRVRKRLAEVSRTAFGKKYRLEIAALVSAQDPPIWARQLARTLDIGENQASSELAEFEKLGALARFPSEYDRRKLYVVVPHWLWDAARDALETEILASDPERGDALLADYWGTMLDGAAPQPVPVKGAGP